MGNLRSGNLLKILRLLLGRLLLGRLLLGRLLLLAKRGSTGRTPWRANGTRWRPCEFVFWPAKVQHKPLDSFKKQKKSQAAALLFLRNAVHGATYSSLTAPHFKAFRKALSRVVETRGRKSILTPDEWVLAEKATRSYLCTGVPLMLSVGKELLQNSVGKVVADSTLQRFYRRMRLRFCACGVWCVVCGVWCVVCGVWWVVVELPVPPARCRPRGV
jgi:hypothetical protein